MRNFYSIFKKCSLFSALSDEQLDNVLTRLNVTVKEYPKNSVVRPHEVAVTQLGIVLKGAVYTCKIDVYGSRFILDEIVAGKTFGESLAFTSAVNSPISIISANNCTIAFIDISRLEGLLGVGEEGVLVNRGLIKTLAEKNIHIQMKNDILSQKTIRKKLLLYFEYQQKSCNSKAFKIDFSREELADFLSLNPSALSRELGKMRDEGLIVFTRNRFTLP